MGSRHSGRFDPSDPSGGSGGSGGSVPARPPCTLERLLEVLGEPVLRLRTAPAGVSATVDEALLLDPHSPLPRSPGGLLLAVGVSLGDAAVPGLLSEAAAAGLCGVVVKEHGPPDAAGGTAQAQAHGLARTEGEAGSPEDPPPDGAGRPGVALLTVDADVPWHHLHLLIASALNAQRSAPGSPGGTALGDLFSLADAMATAVGGATAIEDTGQRILAYSTLPGQHADEERRQGILGLQVPQNDETAEEYRELFRTGRVCRFPARGGGLPRLAVAVRAGGEALGSVWVVDDGSLTEDAADLLTQGASTVALHLLRTRAAAELARSRQGDLLRRVLEGGGGSGRAAARLGLRQDAPVRLAAFALTGELAAASAEQTAMRLLDLVRVQCEARYGLQACALVDGVVYALLPAPGERDLPRQRRLAGDITRGAAGSLRVPVVAALSPAAQGPDRVAASRSDTDLALRVLLARRQDGADTAVAAVEDVRAGITLLRLAELLADRPEFAEGPWREVLAHDDSYGTEYATTLLAYLESGCDVARAARQLAVHPNTCRYRLRQLRRHLGIDLDDPDERLVLWLQLRTLRRQDGDVSP